MKLGKILGFEITLDLSWFLVFALVFVMLLGGGYPHPFAISAPPPGPALAFLGAALLFGSVLAHELGHATVGRRLGVEFEGITLFIFGGIARLKDEPRRPSVEFWMTAAGPAVSAALGGLFYLAGYALLAWHASPALAAMLGYLALANTMLALFNMVPAFPLDGGRIFRALLWMWSKDVVAATRWAAYASRGIAIGLIVLGAFGVVAGNLFGLWEVFIGLFVLSAATAAYEQVSLRNRLEGIPVASLLGGEERSIPARMPLNWAVEEFFARTHEAAYPVEDNGAVRGILTAEDVMAVPQRQWPWTTALEVSQPLGSEDAIEDGADAWQAFTTMIRANAARLLVLHDGHIRGVLTRDRMLEILRARGPAA